MAGASPIYYEEIPANEALREASEPSDKAKVGAVDILPFSALGGRRFEILTYLMLLDPPPPVGVTVSLVKASGDEGRDVITHLNGKLRSVVQCKALETPLTRPALLREVLKLAVYDSQQQTVPAEGIDYEIWAPGGLTGPAQKLVQEWPNSLTEDEAKAAFEANKADYKALGEVKWASCAEHVLIDFPLHSRLIQRDGLRLSFELRNNPRLFAHFFQVNVLFDREDVKASLKEMGIRPAYDEDILRVLKDIETFEKDERTFLGSHVFGLSLQHFALMDKDEMKTFMEATLKPYSAVHQVLLSSLARYIENRTTWLRDSLQFSSPNFPYLIMRVLHHRMVSRVSRNLSPKSVNVRVPLNDDELSFRECSEGIICKFWDEFESVKNAYDPTQHAPGSDPEFRARLAAHGLLGSHSRADFENLMRKDLADNLKAVLTIDSEVLSLVPERVMVLSDTTFPVDKPGALKIMFDNFRTIEKLDESKSAPVVHDESKVGKGPPVLSSVTWSPVNYRDGALFRGYNNALVLRGSNFSFEAEVAFRRISQNSPQGEEFWRKPNLLVANYAEIPTGGEGTEGWLTWLGYEFCIRNSTDSSSDWIAFKHAFDLVSVEVELANLIAEGKAARDDGNLEQAEARLRKAWVYADRLYGSDDSNTKKLSSERELNLDELLLSRLRYRTGDQVRIIAEVGSPNGTIRHIKVRHKFAYEIETEDGTISSFSDEQLV